MAPPQARETDTPAAVSLALVARTWHALASADAVAALSSSMAGLDSRQVAERFAQFGPNELPAARSKSLLRRFVDQLNNLLIYILLASALITAALGHAIDTSVILGVVVINAIFGVVQEGKAEQALAAIRSMISPTARVVRDGRRLTIAARELVPGDILLIEAGDRITADARLVSAAGLSTDESALTGESVPSDKRAEADAPDTVLAERSSMVYSGTLATRGQGIGVVVATGKRSEIGRITTLLSSIPDATTPLIRQMNRFARQLSAAIVALSAATLVFAVLVRSYPLDEAFLAVVGMAVAAIPEGLPAVMTITLALGVERMSRRHAIVRQLPAVETLGSVSVICTDKTGTLTHNEMTARHVATTAGIYRVEGGGYAPQGAIICPDGRHGAVSRDDDPALATLLDIATFCNDAAIEPDQTGASWRLEGDPMEGALVVLAAKGGRDIAADRHATRRLGIVPFDAAHRFMATLDRSADGRMWLHVKGAPEDVLTRCSSEMSAEGPRPLDKARWHAIVDELADEGERTLAFAAKAMPAGTVTIAIADIANDLALAGIVGLIDPPREEARRAISEAAAAGIATKMITGDHAATARAIARQLGLANAESLATGTDIDHLSPDALVEVVAATNVFARTTPEHKLRLVEALRRDNAVIAMTGDGVNDAPALKAADVGIAMGRKGTEAAKEASQMVLADDNFASIVAAVKEGRTVYDNLTKVIAWTLPTGFGETCVVMLAILAGHVMPVTPVQILWINMVTAVALGLVLAFEPSEPDVMKRRPRLSSQSLLTPLLVWQIVFVSALFVAGAFAMFWWARSRGVDIAEARTIVVNTIVVFEIFYLFAIRYLRSGSLTIQGIMGTPAVLIGVGTIILLQLAFTYLPIMQHLFGTAAVSLSDGLTIIAAGGVLFAILEIEKRLRRRLAAANRAPGA